jgi:hypothetical protein
MLEFTKPFDGLYAPVTSPQYPEMLDELESLVLDSPPAKLDQSIVTMSKHCVGGSTVGETQGDIQTANHVHVNRRSMVTGPCAIRNLIE